MNSGESIHVKWCFVVLTTTYGNFGFPVPPVPEHDGQVEHKNIVQNQEVRFLPSGKESSDFAIDAFDDDNDKL
jgi:hypothetical protein